MHLLALNNVHGLLYRDGFFNEEIRSTRARRMQSICLHAHFKDVPRHEKNPRQLTSVGLASPTLLAAVKIGVV